MWSKACLLLVLSVGAMMMVLPFLWMISTSCKGTGDVYRIPPQWIPWPFHPENYVKVWEVVPFGRFYLNSIFIAGAVTLGQVLTSVLAAYAFARLEFTGRDRLFMAYLVTVAFKELLHERLTAKGG